MTTDPTESARLHDQILALEAELATVRGLLRTENQRANDAITREEVAEQAAEERAETDDRVMDALNRTIRELRDELHRLTAVPSAPTRQAAPTAWVDGHPQLEAIAAAVWEKCRHTDSGGCVDDDPRNIAVAAYAAVLATQATCPDPIECSHEAALGQAQEIARRLAAHAVGFQDVLDDSDRGPWGRTVGADIAALRELLNAPATLVVPSAPTSRAALRELIATALYESGMTEAEAVGPMTDAVLAAVEEQPAEQQAAATLARECLDRPAVIRWCADRVRSTDGDYAIQAAAEYLDDLATEAEEAVEEQPDTGTPFVTRVLELFSMSHADASGDLFWHVETGNIRLYANVSDVFAWGGSDAEEITPGALPVLEQAYADLKAVEAEEFTAELYAARVRGQRPQGAAYPSDTHEAWRQVSALYDACGPERELGLGNPKAAPAHRAAVAQPGKEA